ncbi:MAG: hypothetical protein HY295_07595 [Thaumarchaeota archaeon]|nr:hypothetical protein [Nitrososphaerota archaeon]
MSKPESKGQRAQKELDIILSRLNALEVSTTDDVQKSLIGIIRVLVDTQIHSLNEFEHLKKAIDLLTLQIFKLENKKNSSL